MSDQQPQPPISFRPTETPRGRRVKAVQLTEPQYASMGAGVRLAQTLGAPARAWVQRVIPQPLLGCVVVVITHQGYPLVPWGAEAPRYPAHAAELADVEPEADWEDEPDA